MFSWIMSFIIAVEGQIVFYYVIHRLPNKAWKKEVAAAYKEHRVIAAELVHSEEVPGKSAMKKLSYRYRVGDVFYKCVMLSDSYPSNKILVFYEKEHPEISSPVYYRDAWVQKFMPSWWAYLLVFLAVLFGVFLFLQYVMRI